MNGTRVFVCVCVCVTQVTRLQANDFVPGNGCIECFGAAELSKGLQPESGVLLHLFVVLLLLWRLCCFFGQIAIGNVISAHLLMSVQFGQMPIACAKPPLAKLNGMCVFRVANVVRNIVAAFHDFTWNSTRIDS